MHSSVVFIHIGTNPLKTVKSKEPPKRLPYPNILFNHFFQCCPCFSLFCLDVLCLEFSCFSICVEALVFLETSIHSPFVDYVKASLSTFGDEEREGVEELALSDCVGISGYFDLFLVEPVFFVEEWAIST
jgi:hypothetical protein